MKYKARIEVRRSVSPYWDGYLAELKGRCGLPCEVGKGTSGPEAVNDLLAQLGPRALKVSRFKEYVTVEVG
jgi:hypothetical protein